MFKILRTRKSTCFTVLGDNNRVAKRKKKKNLLHLHLMSPPSPPSPPQLNQICKAEVFTRSWTPPTSLFVLTRRISICSITFLESICHPHVKGAPLCSEIIKFHKNLGKYNLLLVFLLLGSHLGERCILVLTHWLGRADLMIPANSSRCGGNYEGSPSQIAAADVSDELISKDLSSLSCTNNLIKQQ